MSLRLVVFGNQQGVSMQAMEQLAELDLGLHGITANNAALQAEAFQHGRGSADLIFFLTDLALGQHRASRDFLECQQVVGWLIGSLMFERSAQRFAIQGQMPRLLLMLLQGWQCQGLTVLG